VALHEKTLLLSNSEKEYRVEVIIYHSANPHFPVHLYGFFPAWRLAWSSSRERRDTDTLQTGHIYVCIFGDAVLIMADLFALFPADAGGEGGMVPEDTEGVAGMSFDECPQISMGKIEG
jgi:hypothetical protein